MRSGDGWLPEAARATANALKVLPYSRASFERVGHDVAALYGAQRRRQLGQVEVAEDAADDGG